MAVGAKQLQPCGKFKLNNWKEGKVDNTNDEKGDNKKAPLRMKKRITT
jgi:hypothetical protein